MTHAEQGAALLAAILDDPADDAARLVYADWLSDDGRDALARLVRERVSGPILIRTCGLDEPINLSDCAWRYSSERRVFEGGAKAAFDSLPVYAWPDGTQVWFAAGFVDRVVCPLDAWREHGPAVVAAHPVTRVELTDREPARRAGRYLWYDERLVTGPDVRHSLPDNDGHATTCGDRETAMLYASRRLLALAKRREADPC